MIFGHAGHPHHREENASHPLPLLEGVPQVCFTSLPGGIPVDGLPPAVHTGAGALARDGGP